MNYDEITKITAERISDYITEAVNTDSIAVAEMFHNAAWGVRTLCVPGNRYAPFLGEGSPAMNCSYPTSTRNERNVLESAYNPL